MFLAGKGAWPCWYPLLGPGTELDPTGLLPGIGDLTPLEPNRWLPLGGVATTGGTTLGLAASPLWPLVLGPKGPPKVSGGTPCECLSYGPFDVVEFPETARCELSGSGPCFPGELGDGGITVLSFLFLFFLKIAIIPLSSKNKFVRRE
jgi:hypothetical protein